MRAALMSALVASALTAQVPEEFALPPQATPQEDGGNAWRVQVGGMLLALPRAPGSEQGRVAPLPVLSAQYQDWLVLGSSRIGVGAGAAAHVLQSSGFTWDVGLGVGERRREAQADELAGMGDRRASLWAGTAFRVRAGWFGASASWAAGLGADAGTRGTLSLGLGGRPAPRWYASVALSATWADARQMAFEFGINADQAATRGRLIAQGDPRLRAGEEGPFVPRAGVRDLAATGLLAYAPARRWRVFLLLRDERLGDSATASPLVRRADALSAGVGFSVTI